jgi:hypothetical protein
MTSAEIAAALGGEHRSGAWWRCRCPVHASRGSTLALRDGDRGLIAVCHAGCSRADILAELRRRGLLAGPAGSIRSVPPVMTPRRDDDASRIGAARRIWDAALGARGTPLAASLMARAITIDPPRSLRWAPRCWHAETRSELPAMVALVEHVERGVVGVHRTYLTADYRRRDRASLGPIGGGAVRLGSAADTLMVGEGIETCLAAMQATAMPAWAALSTSGLVALKLPPIVQHVVILADNDPSGAGERAACAAAGRWLGEGRQVQIAMPPEHGTDFNNLLLGRGHAGEMRDAAA